MSVRCAYVTTVRFGSIAVVDHWLLTANYSRFVSPQKFPVSGHPLVITEIAVAVEMRRRSRILRRWPRSGSAVGVQRRAEAVDEGDRNV